jgi:hypothetical protein
VRQLRGAHQLYLEELLEMTDEDLQEMPAKELLKMQKEDQETVKLEMTTVELETSFEEPETPSMTHSKRNGLQHRWCFWRMMCYFTPLYILLFRSPLEMCA